MFMAEEETKALLREVLAVQREQLESMRRSAKRWGEELNRDREVLEVNRRLSEDYRSQTEAHAKATAEYTALIRSGRIPPIIRAIGMLLIGAGPCYLIIFELPRHY